MAARASLSIFLSISLVFMGFANRAHCGEKPGNLLINELSPYLLKHATNPVNWHPWGEEAFSLAKKKDKPILLSIGYLTCHWCNVMEEESFSDAQVAELITTFSLRSRWTGKNGLISTKST
jgi:thioredoxin-related protein